MLLKNIVQEIIEETAINGGCTLWMTAQFEPKGGYVVGNNGTSVKLTTEQFTTTAVQAFILNFDHKTADGIGTWFDEDERMYYLDYAQHVWSLERAMELAHERSELAIYDIANGRCIEVPRSAGTN